MLRRKSMYDPGRIMLVNYPLDSDFPGVWVDEWALSCMSRLSQQAQASGQAPVNSTV